MTVLRPLKILDVLASTKFGKISKNNNFSISLKLPFFVLNASFVLVRTLGSVSVEWEKIFTGLYDPGYMPKVK